MFSCLALPCSLSLAISLTLLEISSLFFMFSSSAFLMLLDIMSLNLIRSMIFFLSYSVSLLRCSISRVRAFTPFLVRFFSYSASFFSFVMRSLSVTRPLFTRLYTLFIFSSSLFLFLNSPISTSRLSILTLSESQSLITLSC